jgi:hypothetical protein
MNVFKKLIASDTIRNRSDLKKYFWIMAKKLHPDLSNIEGSEKGFIKLKKDFDDALSEMPDREELLGDRGIPTRKEIIGLFLDIEASSFPVDIRIRHQSRVYRKRIEEFSKRIRKYEPGGVDDFDGVEDELYAIRGENIVDNPLFGIIRMIFYNVCSFHYYPTAHTKRAVDKWYSEIREELGNRGFPRVQAFLKWLVDDLNNGSAINP